MLQFPSVDPIPLPAPVWLFKLLHIVTLVLHFAAVQLMLGSLTLATIWNFFGKSDSAKRAASNSIIKKLPTVMTYVINFGVPPLLFAQVLYGRALYTSSVLIGVYWIAVVFLLIGAYYLLYLAANRANENKSWWVFGIVSFIVQAYIARIFSTNMVLMLRPEDWQAVYQASNGFGNIMPTGIPTVLPRFLFMVVGSFALSGAAMSVLGAFKTQDEKTADFLRRWGGGLAVVFALIQAALGYWVFRAQPSAVKSGLFEHKLYFYGIAAFLACTLLLVASGALVTLIKTAKAKLITAVAVLSGVLVTASTVLVRDGIRDLTLFSKGFDVWNRAVVANWSVVILFLVLFVAGLALIGFMLYTVSKAAKKLAEEKAGTEQSKAATV